MLLPYGDSLVVSHQHALEAPAAHQAAGRVAPTHSATPPRPVVTRGYPVSLARRSSFSGMETLCNADEPLGPEVFKRVMRRSEHLETIPALARCPGSGKPSKISVWIQTVYTILSPAGGEVSEWWAWAVGVAQQAHRRYLATAMVLKMIRPSSGSASRTGSL